MTELMPESVQIDAFQRRRLWHICAGTGADRGGAGDDGYLPPMRVDGAFLVHHCRVLLRFLLPVLVMEKNSFRHDSKNGQGM